MQRPYLELPLHTTWPVDWQADDVAFPSLPESGWTGEGVEGDVGADAVLVMTVVKTDDGRAAGGPDG